VPQALGAFRTFSFRLIDAADCSILSVKRCLKNLILEAKVVVKYSNLSQRAWQYITRANNVNRPSAYGERRGEARRSEERFLARITSLRSCIHHQISSIYMAILMTTIFFKLYINV
jgi:hypothetical protein